MKLEQKRDEILRTIFLLPLPQCGYNNYKET
jgi:hypothetical protein